MQFGDRMCSRSRLLFTPQRSIASLRFASALLELKDGAFMLASNACAVEVRAFPNAQSVGADGPDPRQLGSGRAVLLDRGLALSFYMSGPLTTTPKNIRGCLGWLV